MKQIEFIDTEQIGGCQRQRRKEVGKMDEEGQKVQNSSHKSSHVNVRYSTVTIVNNNVSCI